LLHTRGSGGSGWYPMATAVVQDFHQSNAVVASHCRLTVTAIAAADAPCVGMATNSLFGDDGSKQRHFVQFYELTRCLQLNI